MSKNTPLVLSPPSALTIPERESVLLKMRHTLAQAWGVDAAVQLAISEGELTLDQLENLSVLTRRLFDDMEALSAFVDDIGITEHITGRAGHGHD